MRKILLALFLVFYTISTAHAQSQGETMGLGGGATKIFGYTNESLAAIASADGDANYPALSSKGEFYTRVSDGTDTLAVMPISGATSLTGIGSPVVGYARIGSDLIEAASTTTVLNLTAHAARVGDVIATTAGTAGNIQVWSPVASVTTNTVTLSNALPATPANGDTVNIWRPNIIASTGLTSSTNGSALQVSMDGNYQLTTASGILKFEDGGHNSADVGVAVWAVRNEALNTLTNTDGDYTALGTGPKGNLFTSVWYDPAIGSAGPVRAEDAGFGDTNPVMVAGAIYQSSATQSAGTSGDVSTLQVDSNGALRTSHVRSGFSTDPLRAEDEILGNGETLIVVGGQINNGVTSKAADGDAAFLSLGAYGEALAQLIHDPNIGSSASVTIQEDDGIAASKAMVMVAAQREDPLVVDTNANLDATPLKTDKFGRLNVSLGPEGSLFKCNSAADVTDTNAAEVCAADADEIYNITAITCTNTDATVGTRIDILDGAATVVWQLVVGAGAATTNTASQSFVTPLKMAAINTAINMDNATNSAQTRCSIAGFKTPS